MSTYETVIGLEVHAQLKTKSKIFCSCSTRFGEEPNSNTCPVCTGMPGVLPVLNERAVKFALTMALAVGCRVNPRSVFARKNYFYPDLPKGYQISQYEEPLAEHGVVRIQTVNGPKDVGILRIHMEEDAGKLIHSPNENLSLVDLNRTGTPLIEIVSQPDMSSSDEAVAYLKSLRSILVYLGICDGNMEQGSFRCDANVSIRPRGEKRLGTRTELKNLNSFRHVQKALDYEIERQQDLLDEGQKVVQETRLFDEASGGTRSMRGKEEAHDYRYFPDPDLVPLVMDPDWVKRLEQELPELPGPRMDRFTTQYGLSEPDARVLTAEQDLADFFEEAVREYQAPRKICNWILSEMLREMRESGVSARDAAFTPSHLASLVRLVEEGTISGKIGKQIFPEVFAEGVDPAAYVSAKGLAQISDHSELESVVEEVLAQHPEEAAAYKAGKTRLMGFFVGQVMRRTKGQANPQLVNEILARKLA
ncbi:MAG: Asp-tRNA(Asn)/Glu-tRNA(Gln) amidotransferase subunit GatB [Desulfohalobiaceae bacterium]